MQKDFPRFTRNNSAATVDARHFSARARQGFRLPLAVVTAVAVPALTFTPLTSAAAQTPQLSSHSTSHIVVLDNSDEPYRAGIGIATKDEGRDSYTTTFLGGGWGDPAEADGEDEYTTSAFVKEAYSRKTGELLPPMPQPSGTWAEQLKEVLAWQEANPARYRGVAGVVVTFSSSPEVTFSAPTCTTNSTGKCSVTVTSVVAGTYPIHARVDGKEIGNSPTRVEFIPVRSQTSASAAS